MTSLRRSSLHRATVAFISAIAVLSAVATNSSTARAAGVSSALKQATGFSASQLTARPACGVAQPGQIRCLAQVLTVKGSGRPVSLLHVPHVRSLSHMATAAAAPGQYSAGYLQWAYDTSWLSANNGAGDTVAIVDAYGDSTAYSDMVQFRSANGLPPLPTCSGTITTSCFKVVNQSGQTSPLPNDTRDETGSWNVEESLDIDAVSSLCPLCKIVVVEANSDDYYGSPDLETGVSTAAGLSGVNQISLSWGSPSFPAETQNAAPYNSINSAAILAAAGDDSYIGPYIDYPAALPDVTAVGGTALTTDSSVARGFDESTWSKQTCADGSTCGTESGCDTSQSKPSYQTSTITDCPTGRAYNDISADADPNTGLEIYDSQPGGEGCGTPSNWCIIGGTSLATPLTAGFEAIAGVTDKTPAWTYTNASLLNDIVSGSDGTCLSGEYLICNAGVGWDGPTGNGSISGDVATGPPGIGADTATGVNGEDVTFSGGVYTNGAGTSSNWAYWVNGNTGTTRDTATSPLYGAGAQPVADTLCGSLTPATTYDYELVATNASGTVVGYQGSFATPASESTPTASAAPSISGSTEPGQTLVAQEPSWNDQSCNSSPTYQWQESSTASGPWTAVGTSSAYALTSADLGKFVRFVGTESNAVGVGTSASAAVGPVAVPTNPPVTTTTTTTTTTTVTTRTSTTATVRFYRCGRGCVLIDTHGATKYRPRKADYGRYIKAVTTVTRTANNTRTVSVTTRWVGPISSSTAGAVTIGGSARLASVSAIKTSTHKLLAQVRIVKHAGWTLTLRVSRAGRKPTQEWAYVINKGAVVSCTRTHTLRGSLKLNVVLRPGQTLKLVAVTT